MSLQAHKDHFVLHVGIDKVCCFQNLWKRLWQDFSRIDMVMNVSNVVWVDDVPLERTLAIRHTLMTPNWGTGRRLDLQKNHLLSSNESEIVTLQPQK